MKTKLAVMILGLAAALIANRAMAQTNSYQQTNLVSDVSGMAAHTDPKLVNPWGISFFPGQPFWIADNNSGFSTLYDAAGNSQQPTVTIPPPSGSNAPATPTGTVTNATPGFVVGSGPSLFIFDTEDGTISGWNGTGTNAILAVDRSKVGAGAVYKGLAIITSNNNTFLLATNFRSGQVEVFDDKFQLTNLQGSFTDPNLPTGFAPFGIQLIGNQVYVTYALQDAAKHDPVAGAGNGYLNIFDLNGNFVKRFASKGTLNSPWGIVMAPSSFGSFGGDLLVGNFDDGTINAFNPQSGAFLGQLNGQNGQPIVNSGLWAMVFGSGGTGNPNTMYLTAGIAGESHGLFATLDVSQGGGGQGGQDFSLGASPQSATVPAGGSVRFQLSVTPQDGFSNPVSFTCSAPTGISCSFDPATVTPSSGVATTAMTVSTSSNVRQYRAMSGMQGMWLAMSGLGLFGAVIVGQKKRKRLGKLILSGTLALLLTAVTLLTVGCGGGNMTQAGRGTATVMVTAIAGSDMHTTNVTLNVQ